MKKLLFLMLILPVISFSQKKEVLRYFISKDTLVGVKNQKGEIIVPAEFRSYYVLKGGERIEGSTIPFDGFKINEEREKDTWGYVYDRKGNFLYKPFFYDTGPDNFVEGVRRFVKNGKSGFVDQNGTIVIEAKHDFVSPFNYGYAEFCDECDWEKTDDEHKAVVGGNWGVMNDKGEIVKPILNPSEKDVEVNGQYYSYPFRYNEKEKQILQFFEKYKPLLFDLHALPNSDKVPKEKRKLTFEIVERPKENFPYYRVYSYDSNKNHRDQFEFIVSEDGKKVYHMSYFEEKVPFNKWLKKKIKTMLNYQEEHPDHPNKLEINKYNNIISGI